MALAMRTKIAGLLLLVASVALGAGADKPKLAASAGLEIAYPEGYRTWTHVKSQIATPTHSRAAAIGGIHHIYANDQAMKGYKSGSFPDGSIIVFDLLEVHEKDHSLIEGERRWLAVMEKNSQTYAATGGWGYENFTGSSRTDRNVPVNGPLSNCFACHLQNKSSDYVFSSFRE